MKQRRQHLCAICNKPTLYGAVLCSAACTKEKEARHSTHAKYLLGVGFAPHATMQNAFVKDGVAVTLERIGHVGLDKALLHHGHAVSHHRSAQAQPAAAEAAG